MLLGTVLVYWPALSAGFIWDDDDHVTANPIVQDPGGLPRIWLEPGATPQYYPLVFTTFWLEHKLWGLAPLGYHLVNILLHAANAILLWLVLRRLAVPGPWVVAAIFAVHPVQVETVTWVTERKNTLSSLFYLAALLTYMRFQRFDGAEPRPRRWAPYPTVLVLFLCALLSKTVTCSLPAAILLLAWWKRGRLDWRRIWPLLPMFVLGVLAAGTTVWLEKHSIGAAGVHWDLSALDRVLIAGRAVWFYIAKLLWPANLVFIYPRWEIDPRQAWQWLFPLATLAAPITLWLLRKRIGRGPLTAVLLYGGTLLPALGFIDVYPMRYSFVADHFQYLASAALLALLVAAVLQLASRATEAAGRMRHLAPTAAAVVLLPVLGLLSWRQTHMYHDLETLWRTTLARNPAAHMAYLNLGGLLKSAARHDEAYAYYTAALKLDARQDEIYYNLGLLMVTLGRPHEARAYYEQALRESADSVPALNNPAWLLATHPDPTVRDGPRAVELATRAARLAGFGSPSILSTLAAAQAEAGQPAAAAALVRQLLARMDPRQHAGLVAELRQELADYESGHAHRQPPAPGP